MTPYANADTVFTDENGKPFERPEPPSPDAPMGEHLRHWRAVYAYNDRVSAEFSRCFAKHFKRALRAP